MHDLLGYIVSDLQWAQFPGNSVPNEDVAVPPALLPRPVIVIPPTPLATASSLKIGVWERKLADNLLTTDYLR